MKTIKLYTAQELKKRYPDAYDKAYDKFKDAQANDPDIPWCGEIMDSLKAIFKASGITLRDYEIGPYCYSSVRFEMEQEVRDLDGQRAMAWLENNLLGDLRERRTFIQRVKHYESWHDFTRYGEIPSCPFTGVCFDEDYLQALQESIKSGESLGDAYSNLADVARKAMESECEGQQSEECFLEQDYHYTRDGIQVY